jgi:tRNA 5-methylaminomethyl-2-thiouridine biosynthesis bifunctional protein
MCIVIPMDTTALDWHDTGPRNARTGDVYFSPRNGLDETRYVFLQSNNLPEGWRDRDVFTVGEIGFGTGLNFLAASTLFLKTAKPNQHLYYIGFEKFPLAAEQACQALARWKDELPLHDALMAQWPMRIPGYHLLPLHKQVTLLLVHDDAAKGLEQLHTPRGIDAWFLDGFAPAKDPSAWHQGLYDAMAAHSHNETRLASFTAVSTVRHGLKAAGFTVKRIHGYGYKWHMSVAGFEGHARPDAPQKPKGVLIKGAGLAGSACAHFLNHHDIPYRVEDPDMALNKAASGNPFGAVKPRLTAKPSPRSAWYTAGYSLTRRLVPKHLRHDFPALHLGAEADLEAYDWHTDHLSRVDNPSVIAGIPIDSSALLFPDTLLVQPKELCEFWRGDSGLCRNDKEDVTILATGAAYPGIRPVRGQVTIVEATNASRDLKAMLFYGGYMAPAVNNQHIVGASFERGRDDTDPSDVEDDDNLRKLAEAVPALKQDWNIIGRRAAVRANTPDRLPLVGKIGEDTYISVGHGSHGLLSAPLAAAIIVAHMLGLPAPVPKDVLRAVAGDRLAGTLDRKAQ